MDYFTAYIAFATIVLVMLMLICVLLVVLTDAVRDFKAQEAKWLDEAELADERYYGGQNDFPV